MKTARYFRIFCVSSALVCLVAAMATRVAAASEPAFLDWSQLEAHAEGIRVAAKKNGQDFEYLRIETEWGVDELDEDEIREIPNPILKSLNVVLFPVTVDASQYEYHVQLGFRGGDYDDRQESCWDADMYLPHDFARIFVDSDGIREIKTFRSECEPIEDY